MESRDDDGGMAVLSYICIIFDTVQGNIPVHICPVL